MTDIIASPDGIVGGRRVQGLPRRFTDVAGDGSEYAEQIVLTEGTSVTDIIASPDGIVGGKRVESLPRRFVDVAGDGTEYAERVAATGVALGLFGDGSDGDVVISVDTVLTRDLFCNNLTINPGVTLRWASNNGYVLMVLVRGTLHIRGTLSGDGAAAVGATGGPVSLFVSGIAGLDGVSTGPGGDNSGNNNGSLNLAGDGGASGANAGGSGANANPLAATPWVLPHTYHGVLGISSVYLSQANSAGSGGGSGGADGTHLSGGGGAGGDYLPIIANRIQNDGVISAKGGKGGDAAGVGNSGGGGGGGGGLVVLYTAKYSGAAPDVSGGAGGAGHGTGGNGTAGAAGVVIQIGA